MQLADNPKNLVMTGAIAIRSGDRTLTLRQDIAVFELGVLYFNTLAIPDAPKIRDDQFLGFLTHKTERKPMTFLYPELPPSGAAPTVLTTPQPGPSDEYVRHILIGSPEALRETIYVLHQRRYVEQALWTGPVAIGPSGVQITRNEGQVLFYLMRRRSLDVPN